MSFFGEDIISRLPSHSVLHDLNHPMSKIINNGVGEWLDNYDVDTWLLQSFIQDATGAYLDLHGKEYGVKRKTDEDDESYRQRIIYEMLGHLTVDYISDVYGVELYTNPKGTSFVEGVTLVSDNPYLINDVASVDGFLGKTDIDTQKILNKKFVLGDVITWL